MSIQTLLAELVSTLSS